MSTISITEIPTITLLYKLNKLVPASFPADANATSQFNDKISLIRHDITKLETDAIVNAANEALLGGGGVDGAIHCAAGPQLLRECESLGGCDTGDAKITDAYELPCKKVIHAVGPVYARAKRQGKHTSLLQSCYTTSLDLAVQNNCTSIAFSALSTGVYGYPSDEAAETAIQAVKGWLEEDTARAKKMERIVFCQFMEKDQMAYERFIPKYFSPGASTSEKNEPDDHSVSESTSDTKGTEDATTKAKEESHTVLHLPNVPAEEPKQPEEPQFKKQKTSGPTEA